MLKQQQSAIGLTAYLQIDYDSALKRVIDALKTEGFGVLTEIDVKVTFKQRLDVDFRPYTILGACNPPLAYRALSSTPEAGLLLPCNVTVAQLEDGRIRVNLIDPRAMLQVIPGEGLQPIAQEAYERLSRVQAALEAMEMEV